MVLFFVTLVGYLGFLALAIFSDFFPSARTSARNLFRSLDLSDTWLTLGVLVILAILLGVAFVLEQAMNKGKPPKTRAQYK